MNELGQDVMRAVMVIPVYNHAGAVGGVLSRAAGMGPPIVVVDDGSTDGTARVLSEWVREHPGAGVEIVTHPVNRGKAAALRTGFERARAMGATHAATIDADGQLDPEDVPRLVEEARRHPRALILGSRPEEMEGRPARCHVGRRYASLGVAAQTGVRLSDTQCGLRVYPLELVGAVRCRAGRYAFEAEVITRAVWAGYEVREAPVSCRYLPGSGRVSHFRPWRDSLRQGGVHARLLGAALVPWPARRGSRGAARGSRLQRFWSWFNPIRSWREVREESIGDLELASGLAVGAWIGTLPFYGLHTVMSMYVAWRLHLHPAAVVLGSQVSTPPLGIALAAGSMMIGHFMLTGRALEFDGTELTWATAWRIPLQRFGEWMLGSVVMGTGVGAIAHAIGLRVAQRARRG